MSVLALLLAELIRSCALVPCLLLSGLLLLGVGLARGRLGWSILCRRLSCTAARESTGCFCLRSSLVCCLALLSSCSGAHVNHFYSLADVELGLNHHALRFDLLDIERWLVVASSVLGLVVGCLLRWGWLALAFFLL